MLGRHGDRIRSAGAIVGAGIAVLLLGVGAKVIFERRKKRSPSFPADATPARPPSQTKSPS
jgi:hypothetical protein